MVNKVWNLSMNNRMTFVEIETQGKSEIAAREGICPSCRRIGFIGYGLDKGPRKGPVGVCLCKDCWTMWWYTLASRRLWDLEATE